MRALMRRLLPLIVLGALAVACSAPVIAGRWQVADNPEAGLEVKADGTFQGEIGPAGGPRVRLNGTWVASGSNVTFTPTATAQSSAPLPLTGKVDGDTMSLSASMPGTGTLSLTLKRQSSR